MNYPRELVMRYPFEEGYLMTNTDHSSWYFHFALGDHDGKYGQQEN